MFVPKIGVKEIVERMIPLRDDAEEKARKRYAAESERARKAAEETEARWRAVAKRWVKDTLPLMIEEATFARQHELKLGEDPGWIEGAPIRYVVAILRTMDDVEVRMTSYYGSGRTDEDGYTDSSYDTYYVSWQE